MTDLTIITNNLPRNLVYGYELTESEKADFDHLDDIDSHDFFRYRGNIYNPSEFMSTTASVSSPFPEWQGYESDSCFSGTVIKYTEDCEQVIVGRYYC